MTGKSQIAAILFATLLPLLACGRSTAPQATATDLTRAQTRWPSATMDELAKGRRLFVGRCGSCHQLPVPGRISPNDWPGIVDRKREAAKLSDRQARSVERYLVTMSEQRRRP